MKKAISARIDEDTLQYCKQNGGKLNTLINDLLKGWMTKNQTKQLVAFQIETGTDELNKLGTDFKCSQSCKNCRFLNRKNNRKCIKCHFITPGINFCCIYWEKKKGSK